MNTIKEFEEKASRLLGSVKTLTVKEISDRPEDYDIDYLADALLEVDIFATKEDTIKAVVDYLESLNILFIPADFHPIDECMKSDSIYESFEGKTIRKMLFDEANAYYKLDNKYRLDRDINKYRIQVRPNGKDIENLYDFLTKTKETLLKISKDYNDEIELCPYQIDNEVDGSIIYKEGEEDFYCLKFYFEDQIERMIYITACMLVQVARNQEEFDKLMFIAQ